MKDKLSKNTNWFITLFGVIAICLIVCYIVELLPSTMTTVDLTTEKMYTLTDTTKKVLDELEEEVTIYALYDRLVGEADASNTGKAELVRLLDMYDAYQKVNVKYVDLDKNPSFLKNTVGEAQASLYTSDDYIVKCGDNLRRVEDSELYVNETYQYYYTYTSGIQAESKFTSSILKVLETPPVIYYSTDFGESDISNYKMLVSYIEDSGYDFMPVSLKTDAIPEDAACIMFFGPSEDLTDSVLDKMDRWLKKGNNAFFFMDVKDFKTGAFFYNDFTYFNKLFANYGIKIEKTLVKEADNISDKSDIIFTANTNAAGALEKQPNKFTFYAANARSINVDNMSDYVEAEAFIKTSTKATSISVDDDNNTRTGEAVIAASGICKEGLQNSKICVFGSSMSFTDMVLTYFGAENPKSIMKYSMEWMNMGSKSNVGDSIEAKTYNSGITSIVNATQNQVKVFTILTMIVIPAVILIIGIVVFIRRRHL